MEAAKRDWAKAWARNPKASYVGGEWSPEPGDLISAINPANLMEIGKFYEASPTVVEAAVSAAKAAFPQWKAVSRKERAAKLNAIAQVIRKHHAELATLEALNNGKLYREAFVDDLPETAEIFEYYAGWTNKLYGETAPVEGDFLNYTVREPVGVCALIVPWNFPLLLAAWKLAPALAMGNTVVLKPSPYTSLSAVRLIEILSEAQILPRGVLNLVLGGAPVGEALTQHPQVAKISFTGSTQIGKQIASQAALSNLKGVSLELGGKSPNIIFEDAPDLDFAVERSFGGMFSHKGEKCSEPTRLLLQESIYEKVTERLIKKAEAVVCGDPFDETSDQGAQCHPAHFDKVMGYIESGKSEGARLLAGGKRDTNAGNAKGLFVRPTIFGDVRSGMRIAREEIFGPVLCVSSFRTEEEVIQMANDTIYGLAAGLWTRDITRAHRVADRLEAGQVFINKYGCYDFASPFGGFKQSGWGKEMARHSLESYTRLKSIWVKL